MTWALRRTQFGKRPICWVSVHMVQTPGKVPCSLIGKWSPPWAAHWSPGEPVAPAASFDRVQRSPGLLQPSWRRKSEHRRLETSGSQDGAQEIGAEVQTHSKSGQDFENYPCGNTLGSHCSNGNWENQWVENHHGQNLKQLNGTTIMHNTPVKKLAPNSSSIT